MAILLGNEDFKKEMVKLPVTRGLLSEQVLCPSHSHLEVKCNADEEMPKNSQQCTDQVFLQVKEIQAIHLPFQMFMG